MKRWRNIFITLFVITWTLWFHYESTRYFYLQPFFKRELPKPKFLFPPAGWIMFFNVDPQFGYAEVYGVKGGQPQPIDPHLIFRTRSIGYDNIHRNVLSVALDRQVQGPFCRYLKWRFPYFENFLVTQIYYPSVKEKPFERIQTIVYQCQ